MGSHGRRVVILAAVSLLPVAVAISLLLSLGVASKHASLGTAGAPRGGDVADSNRIREPRGFSLPRHRLLGPAGTTEFFGMGPCEAGFCYTPGEPVIAVGPNDIVETVNEAAVVYTKTGTMLKEFDFANFWGPSNDNCSDPRALYIASVNRFAIGCTDITTPNSPLRFAISQTSDPTGAWHLYAAPNTTSLDQDKIEATSDKFIIAANTSASEPIYVYNLADVVAGVSNPRVVTLIAKKSNVYEAAVQQTATSNGYFVSSFPGKQLDIATVTGTPAANNVALKETSIAPKDFPAPSEPQVPGGAIGGGDLDGRTYDAVYEQETSDGKPVIAYSSARDCGVRTCVSSGVIDLSGTTPVLRSNALVGEPGFDYSYGAVGLDASGHQFDVYTRSSASSDPAAAVTGPGFDVTLQPAGAGTTTCNGASPPCDERWGDYVGTALDPSDPTAVWVSDLYQAGDGTFGWGTVIAKVSTTTFSLPTIGTPASSKITTTGATISGTVDPNGVTTTYHFDYGLTSGYDTATTETAAGSGTTPVHVSATLTGLLPNTTYHYRIVATTSTGSAVSADKTFKTSAPTVTAVTFTGTTSNPTVTITGSNFDTIPPANPSTPLTCVPGDTSFDYGSSGLKFNDSTRLWTAGQTGDCIGLIVSSYSNTKIVYRFGADYSNFSPVTNGDTYKLTIWGASHSGTVTYS